MLHAMSAGLKSAVPMIHPTSRMVGIAGEHYAAMQLAQHGMLPILLAPGHPGIDLIAEDDSTTLTFQVKTRGADNPHAYDLDGDRLSADFLVIVRLNLWHTHGTVAGGSRYLPPESPQPPRAWVLPLEVAQLVWDIAGYRHPQRPALHTGKVIDILADWDEAWTSVTDELAARKKAAQKLVLQLAQPL